MPKTKRKRTRITDTAGSSVSSSADSDRPKRQVKKIKCLNYDLKRIHALQKKIDQTARSETIIEVKGTPSNPQVIITCCPSVFEFLKTQLHSKLDERNSIQTFKDNEDSTGLVVHSTTKAINQEKEKLYVINFYNTTSRIQVNGTSDVAIFLADYEKVLSGLNQSDVDLGNLLIKSACKNVIDDMHTTECNQGASTSGLQSLTSTNASSTDHHAATCNTKDIDMESQQSLSSTSISSTSKIPNPDLKLSSPYDITEIMHRLKSLETKQNKMEREIRQLKDENHHLKIQLSLKNQSTNGPESYRSAVSKNIATPQHRPSPGNTSTLPASHSTGNKSKPQTLEFQSNRKEEKRIPSNDFKPNQSVVVSITKASSTYTNFQQDEIRRTINRKFGSTVIQKVTRYNFHSEKPKFIIQLQSEAAAKDLVAKWENNLFGGSSARTTMQPKDTSTTTIIKGVPLDADDNEVLDDIQHQFPDTELERIYKQGKKLRSILVKFKTKEMYQEALNLHDGFLLKSQLVTINFEAIING